MTSPHEILKQYWGHADFRPLQLDIITAALEGKDTLALLPTGGGKSICFQVPALCMEGICIVVSPLIALMKDQVENLRNKNISAAALYSGMSSREIETTLNSAVNGAYKFLYLSPERLQSEHTRDKISQMQVNLLAIDEAHCISQWGYDFRPEYLLVANIREHLPKAPVLALTASATKDVVADIQARLEFKAPLVFRKSFERKNLQYVVRETDDKFNKLIEICNRVKGSGLVYTRNRRLTQEIASWLKNNKIDSAYYHAGLSNKERNKIQEDWIKNKTRVIVCTNAFGMGIDKPDVRFVIHYQMPATLEAYYQEAGRAGRDGNQAYCVVLHHNTDEKDAYRLLEQKYLGKTEVKRIYEMLCNYFKVPVGGGFEQSFEFDIAAFCKATQTKPTSVVAALKVLENNSLLMASPAFFTPSRLQITADSTSLYQFQLHHPAEAEIIKSVIRSYGGVFDYYTQINEAEIADRTLNTSPEAVTQCLLKLHQGKYADYIPQNDSPKIIFISPRLQQSHLEINEELQIQLEKIETIKLEKACEYASQSNHCRSLTILEYFDEADAASCGVCDVCLTKARKEITSVRFEEIYQAIQTQLKKNPLTRTALSTQIACTKIELDTVLKFLIANELVVMNSKNEIALK